ncbi:hypothetical protein [Streptomyces anthocyanicus]|uniref:hypothetical protein n=1 Tax=Streptomyces anthocyanicus TaxID=68174 RepID=UPI003809750F
MNPPAYFHKVLPAGPRADAEEFGWLQVAGRLQVPALLDRTRRDEHTEVITYEDVFASGRCHYLLGDLIALADHGRAPDSDVADFIDAVCDTLIASTAATGRTTALADCVPALYTDRIRPGGRVDQWYLSPELTLTDTGTGEPLPLGALTGYTATINGTRLPFDLPDTIERARNALHPDSQWTTAITQGDPTEPNLSTSAVGPCWLDFEHAGRNTLPGEIANLLWYLLALGGWLVPAYQSDVYARTLRLHLPPVSTPTLLRPAELSARHHHLNLDYAWPTGAGRHAAITRLLARITSDLGEAAGLPPDRQLPALGPFLTLRVLGVIPPHHLTQQDLLLLIAKLAQAQHLDSVPLTDHDTVALATPAPVETP